MPSFYPQAAISLIESWGPMGTPYRRLNSRVHNKNRSRGMNMNTGSISPVAAAKGSSSM